MEYLTTYGWAILIVAVVAALLFALGLFGQSSSSAPSVCQPQPNFVCTDPIYTNNGISVSIGQNSGQDYYNAWGFITSSSEPFGSGGLPVDFSESNTVNMTPLGLLTPGQTVKLNYENSSDVKAGDIPVANVPVGNQFTGYVWIGYCTTIGCASPTNFAKVGTINVKEGGSAFSGGSPQNGPSSTSTSSTSTSSTSTSTTSIAYVQITMTNTAGSPSSPGFQEEISFQPSQWSAFESYNLGNIRFYSGNAITGSGPLYSWCETNCSNTISSNAIFWVNLGNNQIPAGGTLVINMTFTGATQYDVNYAGESPLQSCPDPSNPSSCTASTYGEYDNGANVFPTLYQNWASGSLSSLGWTNNGGYTVTVDDGLTLSGGCFASCGVYYNTGVDMGAVTLDFYEYFTNLDQNLVSGFYGSDPGNADQYLIWTGNPSTLGAGSGWNGPYYYSNNHIPCGGYCDAMQFNYGSTSSPQVWSISVASSETIDSYDYNVQTLDNGQSTWGSGTGYVGFVANGNANTVDYWVRIREDPPGGPGSQMPGASFTPHV